ncbi:cytochrome P450 [Sinomonas flava]|uniref:cytochrome P450 n=1 Tax=Sinomonas flava TaxID=496857 RepID=UPI0039A422A5
MQQDFTLAGDDDPRRALAVYEGLRGRCPVAHTDDYGGYWALTRHDDVKAAACDAELFVSSVKAVVPSDPRGIRRPPLNFDAPAHTPFRRALSRTLGPARVESILGELGPVARGLWEDFRAGRDPDVCRSFGTLLPAHAAARWLNLDGERVPWLASTATEWVDAWRRQDAEEVTRRSEEMYDVARWLVEDRVSAPRDSRTDPASSLLSEKAEGRPLDRELIVGALRQSLVVGMVAPPLLIGSIVHHLATHPALHAELRDHPELIPAAAEEFIRLYTPYRGFSRTVSREHALHGRTIRPQEPVTLVYAAANRDPDVFPNPDEFVLDRPTIDEHLGFGKGRHQCVGMHLARGIIRTALETVVAGSVRLELLGDPEPTRMPELGYQRVKVAVIS